MPSRLTFLAFALGLCLLTPAAAQQPALDPETKGPCLWRVVVQTKPHPLLTPAVRGQLRRDILAALEPGIAQLGTVDVIDLADLPADKRDPMWQQFIDTGFAALEASRDLTGVKTHFLRIEYRDGAFHLESRQYDGFTGLVSPFVRRQAARAPELLGRTAGLMLDRDFGIAGTAEGVPGKADEAKVLIRGGELGPVNRFVKAGDIFAVSQVRLTKRDAPPPARTATGKIIAPPPGSTPPPALSAQLREYTLLRVLDVSKGGECRCAVFSRQQTGLPAGGGVAAYRCMKLATVEAPVAVRLASPDGRTHQQTATLSVLATDDGFTGKTAPRDNLDFREGLFRSSKPLSNVACVVVSTGPTTSFRFPVAVTSSDPVTLKFNLDPKAEEKAVFERAVLTLASRVSEARNAQTACFSAVAKLITDKKNAEALGRARSGYKSADDAEKGLGEELGQLNEQVGKSREAAPLLASAAQHLQALKRTSGQLMESIKQLEAVVARENDPSVAAQQLQGDALVTRIGLLLARGDVDEAINAYDQLVSLRDNADVKARRDKLKAEWAPKNADHAKARDYLLKSWPALATVQDLKDSLPQVRNAIDACKKADDRHAVRKFLTVVSDFAVKLNDLVAPLDANSDADRKSLADAKEVRDVVGKAETELVEFLKKAE